MPTPEQNEDLLNWKLKKGSLMFRKKQHELTPEERKMMKTPPAGWRYSVENSDWVFEE